MTTLFINACLRGDESRTLELCREYLDGMEDVREIKLAELRLEPLYVENVAYRSQLQTHGDFDDAIFDLAKEFAAAEHIVIGAPYWDLMFPAALKVYIEHVSVCDVTFEYTPQSQCVGKCNAEDLVYITTGGGPVYSMNYGYDYLCGIAKMFGIPQTHQICAEMLDVVGIDIQAQMDIAREQIRALRSA